MKKLIYVLIVLVSLVGGAVTWLYNSHSGQDALFRQGLKTFMRQGPETFDGIRVVVCGSASPMSFDMSRAQACIAVITPEHFFLFDVGARSPQRIAQARLPMDRLTGVFFTHFHSDHIAGAPDVNLASWVQGRKSSLQVYGPAGVDKVVQGFNDAYQLDHEYRVAHHGPDLLPPEAGPMTPVVFVPGEIVWQDNRVKVTSFPVDHAPVLPAVGYRVDYQGRSVVISGDTNATDSLFAAAKNADLLLHDALSRTLLDPMIKTATDLNLPVMPTIMHDIIHYHADTTSLPELAAKAGIKQLALYHMVPVPANSVAEKMFVRGLPEDVILVKDLHRFELPANATEIHIHEP